MRPPLGSCRTVMAYKMPLRGGIHGISSMKGADEIDDATAELHRGWGHAQTSGVPALPSGGGSLFKPADDAHSHVTAEFRPRSLELLSDLCAPR